MTRARQEGQDVTCESCPHYFVLDTDQFEEIGTLAKCSPPIRDLENQKGMWEKLFNGEIDCTVSDHSPCPPEMKAGNIMEAWGGIAGLQNCMDVMFDEAVQKRGMSLPMFGKLMATNAADIFGLQQKGRIAPEKMPTSSSFSRIAAMFLPMTIWNIATKSARMLAVPLARVSRKPSYVVM